MESILGNGAAVAPAPLPPASEADRKRPGMAFLLSLLVPGAGHIYCGKAKAGTATLVFFLLAAIGVLSLPAKNPYWGVAFRAAIILYAYAFLDAFYTAREINVGMAQYMVGNNPRIAAMLNLLTNGFGYFYLGERTKGIAVFIALRAFNLVAQQSEGEPRIPMLALLEVVLLVMAIDAYRLARKQLHETFPEANLDTLAASEGLSPVVPAILGAFFTFNYAALALIGVALPSYKHIDQSTASIAPVETSKKYTNSKYHVSIAFPAEWEVDQKSENSFVEAKRFKGGCDVQLMAEPRLPITSVESFSASLHQQLEKSQWKFQWVSDKPAKLDSLPAKETSFIARVRETEVRQNYVMAPSGLSMYVLIETVAMPLMDQCSGDVESIRESVKLR